MFAGNHSQSQAVSVCFFCLVPRSRQQCECALRTDFRFCTAFLQVPYLSNQLRKLVFPVSEPRPGVPNIWLKLLTSQGGCASPCNPLLFCVHSKYTGPTLITSFSALPEPMWIYLHSPSSTRIFLLVPSLFSSSLTLHVDVFFYVFRAKVRSACSSSSILIYTFLIPNLY